MFFKMLPPSTLAKEISRAATPKVKQINWSLIKQGDSDKRLNSSIQTIVNELENASSCDVPQAPTLK
jgi:hypothetical protein